MHRKRGCKPVTSHLPLRRLSMNAEKSVGGGDFSRWNLKFMFSEGMTCLLNFGRNNYYWINEAIMEE